MPPRKISAVEVIEAALNRIADVDGRPGALDAGKIQPEDLLKVHAFLTITDKHARDQAKEIDRKIAAGEEVGPLAGVPFTVKDIFCVQDTFSTAGSRILANFKAPYTATPVARLEAAGEIMLGKVNLDEFTYGSSNKSSAFQPTPRNPWDPSRVPGGSSGGSTASVAAREAPTFHRHRHSRFDTPAGGVLRSGGSETNLRASLAVWFNRICVISRLPGSDQPNGYRCSPHAASNCRQGPER